MTVAGGRRKSFYAKTRQEVARKLAEALREYDNGIPIVGEKQLVEHFLTYWLDTVKPPILRPQSHLRYEQQVRIHLIPALGKIPLSRLTAQHLQALYAEKFAAGMAPNTVHHLHGTLHRALAAALRLGVVTRNVGDLVQPPPALPQEMQPLTAEQVRAFLSVAAGTRVKALYVLALTTGMRQGGAPRVTENGPESPAA